MKNLNMISRRSFLKAALAASAVSAMALTGCGGAASSTASSAAVSSSAAASGSTAAAGETFKVGIVNYVDHASLNQIVESVESRLDAIGKEKGVTFDYADYYANAQADQSNLNQIGADLVADGVDVIVAVATPSLRWRQPWLRGCAPALSPPFCRQGSGWKALWPVSLSTPAYTPLIWQ